MLDIRDHTCHMGTIANNLENHGEKEHVTGFTLPITEFRLTGHEFDAFFAKPLASRSLFDWKREKPMPALDFIEPIKCTHDFDGATVTLLVTGERSLEFKDAKVKDIMFWPDPIGSGDIELKFKVYVRPGISRENLVLQECQDTDIKLTIQDAQIALKAKDKQQDLFKKNGAGEPAVGEGFAAAAAAAVAKRAQDAGAAVAQTQADAWENGREMPSPAPTDSH